MSKRLNNSSAFTEIKLSGDNAVPNEVQILRVGKFKHQRYGAFEVTPLVLAEMKNNFDNRVRGIDVAFDYFHDSEKEASGWPGGLELREDGKELWAVNVEWTPTALKKLAEKELKYFSPDFTFAWVDPETNVTHKNVLFGGGLTNRPFIKEMKSIVADEENEGKNEMELKEALTKITSLEAALKLSEDQVKDLEVKAAEADKVGELNAQIETLKAQLATLEADKAKLEGDAQAAEEAKQLAEKEIKFNLLLSEGKACAAQKDAFIAGDMAKFIELAEKPNLNGGGSVETPAGTTDEDKVLKLAEEKMKADSKLSQGDAISLVLREMKK